MGLMIRYGDDVLSQNAISVVGARSVVIMAVTYRCVRDRNGGKVSTVTFMRNACAFQNAKQWATKVWKTVDVFFYVCRYHVRTLRQICLSKLPNWLNWLKIIYAEQKNMRCSVGATLLVPLIWTLKAKLRENYCKTPRLNTSSWPSFRSVNCYNFP